MSVPLKVHVAAGHEPIAPHLQAEELLFLSGSPKEVTDVAIHHREKFVSAGLQKMEDSELLTQGGLHPGSPRHVESQQQRQQRLEAAAAPHHHHHRLQHSSGSGDGSDESPDPYFEMASHVPQSIRFPKPEDGSEFVLGTAAESLDFASEEMDAE